MYLAHRKHPIPFAAVIKERYTGAKSNPFFQHVLVERLLSVWYIAGDGGVEKTRIPEPTERAVHKAAAILFKMLPS